jgi:hypothetical protein
MMCSDVDVKEAEFIFKYRPPYNIETAGRGKFRVKDLKITHMQRKANKHQADLEMENLMTEIAEKKDVDDIITVFKRRL